MGVPLLNIKIYAILGIIVVVLASAGGLYWKIYKSGGDAVRTEQEKALNTLKDKTDAVQDRALTTPAPNDELRKYARPD